MAAFVLGAITKLYVRRKKVQKRKHSGDLQIAAFKADFIPIIKKERKVSSCNNPRTIEGKDTSCVGCEMLVIGDT